MNEKIIPSRMYGYSVRDCNFDFCMHFDEDRRRCGYRRCVYDRKQSARDHETIGNRQKEEAVAWDDSQGAVIHARC